MDFGATHVIGALQERELLVWSLPDIIQHLRSVHDYHPLVQKGNLERGALELRAVDEVANWSLVHDAYCGLGTDAPSHSPL